MSQSAGLVLRELDCMASGVGGLRFRSEEIELLDSENVSDASRAKSYREINGVNRWLGNTRAILKLLRDDRRRDQARTTRSGLSDARPFRVLDLGCGQGALLVEIREKLGADVIGLDMQPAPRSGPVPILHGNAVTDALPKADVAICVLMAHHLGESELIAMIQNVSRSCERLIVLDLVRHSVPLWLFRFFVAPWLCRINAADGQTSVQRAFTIEEMEELVKIALGSSVRPVRSVGHTVAPLWMRQVMDIRWEPLASS